MEPFVKVFFAIDKDETEQITASELRQYVKENHLDESMITRWTSLFDPQNTGRITFSKFCEVLGLRPEEARVMRTNLESSPAGLHHDIKVLDANMDLPDQIKISEEARRLATPPESFDPDQANKQLKRWLDQNFKPTWHVVLIKGSHWITFSYCPNNSFQFRLYDYTYLIWRTPDLEFIN